MRYEVRNYGNTGPGPELGNTDSLAEARRLLDAARAEGALGAYIYDHRDRDYSFDGQRWWDGVGREEARPWKQRGPGRAATRPGPETSKPEENTP